MSQPITSYRDLIAWQKAFDLGLFAHELSHKLPDHERYGLTAAIRRQSYQIAGLIADGYGQQNTGEYIRHLRSARGDLYYLDTQMLYGVKFGYIAETEHQAFAAKLEECAKVLAGLLRSLER